MAAALAGVLGVGLAAGCAAVPGDASAVERSPLPVSRPATLPTEEPPAAAPAGAAETSPTASPAPAEIASADSADTIATAVAAPASFAAWRAQFRAKALAAGIPAATFDDAFAGVRVNATVLERDRFQPEFTRPIWQYLDSAVSDLRVRNGQRLADEKAVLMAEIEAKHGVDSAVVLAIWGLESAYGANYGSMRVIESLATLAYDSRRQAFAERELLAALRILAAGDIAPARMVGSWAGAMGHTQFIPTSFEAYAVDHDGDGRRDVWSADAADALASTANYLARFGWRQGAPAAVEVRLPEGFDYGLAGGKPQSAATWTALGVRPTVGGALTPADTVEIILPAGADGPAFATYPNFDVIKRYNNATSYALAVSHLADRIEGAPPFQAPWPRDDRALSRDETREVQRLLTARGYDTQGVDGIVGPQTRAAVRAFQSATGKVPDGYVSDRLLDALRDG
ncbi:MAG: lytic murein transglycosylase [Pseudomonadota bacterium]